MPEYNIKDFTYSLKQPLSTGTAYSHLLSGGRLAGNLKYWICKECKNPQLAKSEALAQEFFRLIVPHQPETRIAKNDKFGTYYILSEEVSGYHNLPENMPKKFMNETFTGLGQALVLAMFLQEVDLKNGNIGLDNSQRVIKIDGDWSFAETRMPGQYRITTKAIESLPYPQDFYAFNWLDIIKQEVKNPQSTIVNFSLSNAPQFRAEVNQALLMVCLIPDNFIESFVEAYMPSSGISYANLIKKRRDALITSVLENQSFLSYLHSPAASITAKKILAQMKAFKSGEAPIIPLTQHAGLDASFEKMKERLGEGKKLLIECENILSVMEKQCHIQDRLVLDFINACKDLFIKPPGYKALVKIKNILDTVNASINSHEIVAVKAAIKNLRANDGFFSIGMSDKANAIEQALYKIPLEERENVISSSKVNPVQVALATHRHSLSGAPLDASGAIIIAEAADTFKQLRKQFPVVKTLNPKEDDEIPDFRIKN